MPDRRRYGARHHVIVRRFRAVDMDPDMKIGQRVRLGGLRGVFTVVDIDGTGAVTLSARDDETGQVLEIDVRPREPA